MPAVWAHCHLERAYVGFYPAVEVFFLCQMTCLELAHHVLVGLAQTACFQTVRPDLIWGLVGVGLVPTAAYPWSLVLREAPSVPGRENQAGIRQRLRV